MLKIGCHLSSSKGFLHMGKEAVSIGANTFQFFTRNPRGSKAKPIDEEDVRAYLSYAKEHEIEKNNQLLQIMATALSNMIQTILVYYKYYI